MKLSKEDLKKYLSIAEEASRLAGGFLSKRDPEAVKINKELAKDIKIAADVKAEKIIIDFLKEKTDFSILSEEKGETQVGRHPYKWIVDPLDGSLNYLRGIPISCVSIGLWEGEKPILGIVYDFNRSEIFSGITAEGAWMNGSPIRVSEIGKKERAVLVTGFPVNTNFSQDSVNKFIKDAQSYKKLRLIGSAALSIVYVARGMVEAYQEKDIMLWDIAGSLPILLGAGGKIDIKKSDKLYSYNIFASNGLIS